jgi:putative spermidine/putrescine transport system permease protein
MTPSLVVAVALFEYSGVIWSATGLSLQDSLMGIVIGHTACATPYAVRAILAGHSQFDYSLEEAALSLGAGKIRTLASVTIPALAPGIAAGALFGFLISLDDLPIALFMGGDDSTATLPVRIYSAIEYNLKPDIMAVSTLLVAASLVLMIVLDRIVGVDRVFRGREV